MTEQEIKNKFDEKFGNEYDLEYISYMPWGAYIGARSKKNGYIYTFSIDF